MLLHLLPITHTAVIPESYLDDMGHMNVMWYTHLFSCATIGFFQQFGLTREYFKSHHAGSFALEHHVRYLAEVRLGQRVTLRTRALGRSAKRLHFMHFMVRGDGHVLSATGEFVGTHIDMRTRRSSPFPLAIAEAYDGFLHQHSRLDWEAPLCGVMKP